MVKRVCPLEPKIIQPHYASSGSEEASDEESFEDNSDKSDNDNEKGESEDDENGRSEEFDPKLCVEKSENSVDDSNSPSDENSFFNTKIIPDSNPIYIEQEASLHQKKIDNTGDALVNNQTDNQCQVTNQENIACNATVGRKIPSGSDQEVSPSNKLKDDAIEKGHKEVTNETQHINNSDDIFSLDKLIQKEQHRDKGHQSCPPVIRSCQVSSYESSGAPGFIKGVFLKKQM